MAVITLTTTSGSPQTWSVINDCPVGTVVLVEAWGPGSGGSGSGAGGFGAGGAGGAYAAQNYVITPNDYVNGISYTLTAGSAGTANANSTAPTATSFSTNNINLVRNSVNQGAVVGTPR